MEAEVDATPKSFSFELSFASETLFSFNSYSFNSSYPLFEFASTTIISFSKTKSTLFANLNAMMFNAILWKSL